MIDIYKKYEPGNIKDILDATEPSDIPELIRAVMVLCDVVERQERCIDELDAALAKLEKAEEERQADADLAFSVKLYSPSV